MSRLLVSLILFFFSSLVFAAEPVLLTAMRIQPSPTVTRVVFTLTEKTYGKVKYLPNPDRLIVTFAETRKRFQLQNVRLTGSNVKSLDAQSLENGAVQFVFRTTGRVRWTIDFLPKNKDKFERVQLDIISVGLSPSSRAKTNQAKPLKQVFDSDQLLASLAAVTGNKKTALEKNQLVGLARLESPKPSPVKKTKRPFTVVIDAGHGGKDVGAIGKNGTYEKQVVLAIAKRLAQEINQTDNMRAVLTRSGDYYLPLRQRLKLARKGDADLFVAIHADAYFDSSARGASVYALSQRGATSEAARWLAKRENYSELSDLDLNGLQDRSPLLRSVLIDMAQTATIQDSLRLGNKVLDALDNVSSLHYRQVEQAQFVVLKSPDIPSILVETGFITNPREEKRLADATYQTKLAKALLQGIQQYAVKYAGWKE